MAVTIRETESKARPAPGQMHHPERLILCGGSFSDNLGDGIIADCLVWAIGQHLPHTEVVKMDISGRLESHRVGFGPKGRIQTVMNALPPTLGRCVVLIAGSLYLKRAIEPTWQRILQDGDTVIIGGGQLFQDEQLNFPLKMWWLMRNLQRSQARHVVYSVGVSCQWSTLGRRLFGAVFRRPALLYCSVRDDGSRQNLLAHFRRIAPHDVGLDPDPALLAAATYAAVTQDVPKQFDVGIGIMHPRTLLIDARQKHVTAAALSARWRASISALLDRGLSVALFSNGAREDDEYVQRLAQEMRAETRLVVLPQPATPDHLVSYLARMRAIVAHRLHASIVGYALAIPCLGLRWDPKLEEFYAACGRADWVVDFSTIPTEQFVAKAAALAEAPIDLVQQARVVESCRAGVERLADCVLS